MKTFIRNTLGLAVMAATLQSHAADFTMRISHQFPPSHQTSVNLEQFKKDVEAATNHRVDVQILVHRSCSSPTSNTRLLRVARSKPQPS